MEKENSRSNFFALMNRMKYISRWGLMKNTTTENIQEHSLSVAMLAHALAVIRRDVFGDVAEPELCAAAAIFHDATEIITGDLPTPIKYFNPDISTAYKAVESTAAEKLISMLPEEMRATYRQLILCESRLPIGVYSIVKAADRLAAYIKCVEEMKSGNMEFKQASEQIFRSIRDLHMREVDYFIDTFLPGYSLTLDEMG